jgi:hypothetical protein
LKPEERYSWIEAWMGGGGAKANVDVLDSDFVCAYADATKAHATVGMVGAPRCKQLSKDLSAMFAAQRLTRSAVGLPAGDASMSFPKWVYSYSLNSDMAGQRQNGASIPTQSRP